MRFPPRPLLALLAAVALACAGDGLGTSSVAEVVITSPAGAVTLRNFGRQLQFTAEVRDGDGRALEGRVVTWHVTTAAARIGTDGVLTPVAPGAVEVFAVAGSVASARVPVLLDPLPVGITLPADTFTFHSAFRPQSLRAVVRDSSGTAIAVPVTYVVLDTAVAYTAPGPSDTKLLARADGATWVVATAAGVADTARVLVARVPVRLVGLPRALTFTSHTPATLAVEVRDSGGGVLPGYPVSFISADTGVAVVDTAGRAAPRQEGATTFTVAVPGDTVTVPVTTRYVLYSVNVSPGQLHFHTTGRPQRVHLRGYDSTWTDIGPLPDPAHGRSGTIQWVPEADYYQVVSLGNEADLYAVYDGDDGNPFNMMLAPFSTGHQGALRIFVQLYPETFRIDAPVTALAVGDSTVWTVTLADSAGTNLLGRILQYWTISDHSVVTLAGNQGAPDATVTALAPGTAWLVFSAGNRQDSVLVTVH